MADINFFLKDKNKTRTSIDVIIRFKGERYKSATGVSVESQFWDTEAYRCRRTREYPDHAFINQKLDKYESRLKIIFNDWDYNDKIPSLDEFRRAFDSIKKNTEAQKNTFAAHSEQYLENSKINEKTKRGYRSTLALIRKYEEEIGTELTFDKIDLAFYKNFRKWFYAATYEKVMTVDNERVVEQRHYSLNYFGAVIKRIKTIMEDASESFDVPSDYKKKKFKKEQEGSDKIYLTIEELEKIHNYTPTLDDLEMITTERRDYNLEKKQKAIIHDKNAFLIGAFTLQRVSDYSRIKDFNIKGDFIKYKPLKGEGKNDDVVVPMHWIIKEIIENGFDFNKKTYDQKINNHIKEICRLLGFNEQIPITTTEGDNQVQRIYPKWQLVQTHTARRSGATNMLLQKDPPIPVNVIMKLGGWKSEKSFWRYIKIDNQQNAELVKDHPFFKK